MPRDLMYAAEWAKAMEDASAGYRQQKAIEAQQAELERKAQLAQEQDKLAAYLKGQQTNADVEAAMQLRGQLPQGTDVKIGDAAINSPSQGSGLELARFLQGIDDKKDRKVEALSKRTENSLTTRAAAPMARLAERGLLGDPAKINKKSLPGMWTGLAREYLPAGDRIAHAMAKSYGGEDVFQYAQDLYNLDIKDISGSAVSGFEQARNNIKLGLSGDSGALIRGIQQMHEVLKSQDKAMFAGYQPDIVDRYKSQGGPESYTEKVQAAQSNRAPMGDGKNPKPRMSFEEFKAMKRAKNGQ